MAKSNLSFHPTIHLWEITESLEELLDIPELTEDEVNIVMSFRKNNRKKEILASRALLQSVIPGAHIHYVNKNPQLTDIDKEISITHSDNKVMIQLKEKDELCGVDLQEITDKAIRVKTKFLHPSEIKRMDEHEFDTLLLCNLFWSAKETAYKAFANICEQEEVIEFKTQFIFKEIDSENNTMKGQFIEKNKRTEFTLGFSVQTDYVVSWFEE
ncbi:MAG: 4'-phosphopantetheinyl transferase family protein [Flavobacteriales bacterium]